MTSDFKRAVDNGDVLGAVLSFKTLEKEGRVLDKVLGQSPFMYALFRGDLAVISALIETGISLETAGKFELHPLHYVVGKGKVEITKLFFDAGQGAEFADPRSGMTALHHAVESGHLDMVKFVLDKCKDLNVRNKDLWSPLHFAVYQESTDIAQELISAGVLVDAKDKHDLTPLHHASNKEKGSHIINCLVQAGADINYIAAGKWSPLHLAVDAKHIDNSQTLLELGAMVDIPGKKGHTPLRNAKKNCHPAMIRLLESYGANIEVIDDNPTI